MADRKKHVSRGSVVLQAVLSSEPRQRRRFSKLTGRGSDIVSRWSTGERVPVPKDRAMLEDRFGIPWRWWDEGLTSEEADAEWLATEEAREVVSRPFPDGAQAETGAPDAA